MTKLTDLERICRNAESKKRWRDDNREHCTAYTRGYRARYPWLSHYREAKARCENPNRPNYRFYGGRGVRMVLTPLEVELLYKRDNAEKMQHPSIDRLNSNGDYHFGNCRFIEMSENSRRKCEN